jgi:hypothetical protein
MLPSNLTALDFFDIRESIKSYLRTKEEFTDYDFTGSTLSYMLDMLAYNTYYTAFNANMSVNELFLSSSTIRDNVVSLAKLLNYTPRSIVSSKACVKLVVQTEKGNNGEFPTFVTLYKGLVASGTGTDGTSYTFVIPDNISTTVNNIDGTATFNAFIIYEGSLLTFTYVVNKNQDQKYIIPNDKVDTSTLRVQIRANKQSQQVDLYTLAENITEIDSASRNYFLQETEDKRYEVIFGDGVVGRDLTNNELVELQYVKTNGSPANDISEFVFLGKVIDSFERVVTLASCTLSTNEKSQFGSAEESLESIKFLAPRYYSTQFRAVTATDYETIARKVYANIESVVAYGGETVSPPVYGKVYLVIRTKTGTKLNNLTKKTIIKDLRNYSMASIDIEVMDADVMYINLRSLTYYQPYKTNLSESDLETSINDTIKEFAKQEGLNQFNNNFQLSKMLKSVDNSIKAFESTQAQLSISRRFTPNFGQIETYCLNFGNPLYQVNAGLNDLLGTDATDKTLGTLDATCSAVLPSVIRSSSFYTADLPSTAQYFEDDGYGNLRTYYLENAKKVYTNRKSGFVDYSTGKMCFGPINITTAPVNVVSNGTVTVTAIPSNIGTILTPDPGTVLNLTYPDVNVSPVGVKIDFSFLDPNIIAEVPPITNTVDLTVTVPTLTSDSTCF